MSDFAAYRFITRIQDADDYSGVTPVVGDMLSWNGTEYVGLQPGVAGGWGQLDSNGDLSGYRVIVRPETIASAATIVFALGEICQRSDDFGYVTIGDNMSAGGRLLSPIAIATTAQFDVGASTAPATIPGLSLTLLPGTYLFRVNLVCAASNSCGAVISASFTGATSNYIAQGFVNATRQKLTAPTGTLTLSPGGGTTLWAAIEGSITVTVAGTFSLTFADAAAAGGSGGDGTVSSVLKGSSLWIMQAN